MLNNKYVNFCPCYGAEMRGGAVNCEINASDNELLTLQNSEVDIVVALNQTSFDKFISKVKKNGTIIVNSSLAKINKTRDDIKYIFAPMTQEAIKLGNIKIANSIALGIISKITDNFSISRKFHARCFLRTSVMTGYDKKRHPRAFTLPDSAWRKIRGQNLLHIRRGCSRAIPA